MGYKTTNMRESEALQAKGMRVVKIYGHPITHEFEHDITFKNGGDPVIVPKSPLTLSEPASSEAETKEQTPSEAANASADLPQGPAISGEPAAVETQTPQQEPAQQGNAVNETGQSVAGVEAETSANTDDKAKNKGFFGKLRGSKKN